MLKDSFSRVIDYLRLSITDRCNLRCVYCMPAEGIVPFSHSDILSYEEIIRIVEIAASLGVRKVRLTGGEPLTRRDVTFLVSELKKIKGIEDLSMTTNGMLLEEYAERLSRAGLDRVNISIDTFKPERFRQITRTGDLNLVLRGLRAAEDAGLKPVKINMVPVRGINDDEIIDFARLTMTSGCHVRFIECMPSGALDFWDQGMYISTDELKTLIETLGPLTPVRLRKHGPSKYYRIKGAEGVIGFISALTHHFCEDCNRLRLTADGKLRPCLFSETEIDLRAAIRNDAPDSEIERLLRLSIQVKPKGHTIGQAGIAMAHSASELMPCASGKKRPMSQIGG